MCRTLALEHLKLTPPSLMAGGAKAAASITVKPSKGQRPKPVVSSERTNTQVTKLKKADNLTPMELLAQNILLGNHFFCQAKPNSPNLKGLGQNYTIQAGQLFDVLDLEQQVFVTRPQPRLLPGTYDFKETTVRPHVGSSHQEHSNFGQTL